MTRRRPGPLGRAWYMVWSAATGSLVALATSLLVVQAALRLVIAHSDKYFDVLVARALAPGLGGTGTALAAGGGVPVGWRMPPFAGHISAAWVIGQRSELLLIGAGPVAGSVVLGLCVVLAARRLALPRWPLLLSSVACYTVLSGMVQGIAVEWTTAQPEFRITMSSPAAVVAAAGWTLVVGGTVVALRGRPAGHLSAAVRGARRRSAGRLATVTATALVASLVSAGAATAAPAGHDTSGGHKWRLPGVDAAVAALPRVPGVKNSDAENGATGTPSMLVGLRSELRGDDVPEWLQKHAHAFGVSNTRGILRNDDQRRRVKDPSGARHVWYDQVVDGVPVYDARVGVHLDKTGTTVTAVTNGLRPDLIAPASTTPRISAKAAIAVAAKAVPGGRSQNAPVLTIYAGRPQAGVRTPAYLTWQVDIGNGGEENERVFVDALGGDRFVGVEPLTESALNRYVYDQQHLTDPPNQLLYGKLVRTEGTTPSGDRDSDRAYDQTGVVYNYYRTTFGLDSVDNRGYPLKSRVHYGKNFVNANWNGTLMTYGDGMLSQDVTGHEITHAVTENTAGLVYSFQSGALNESISDFFGEMTERYATGRNDWLLGSNLDVYAPFRSMADPRAHGQPQDMSEYVLTCEDNGGVHTDSGIPNYAFYRMVYKLGYSTAVPLVYEALTDYISPTSTFADMYTALMQVSTSIYGPGDYITSVINEIWTVDVGVTATTDDPRPAGCSGDSGTVTCSTLSALYDDASALSADGASLAEVAGSLVHMYNLGTIAEDPAVVYYEHLFLTNRDDFDETIALQGTLLDEFTKAIQLWQPVLEAVGTDQATSVVLTQQQIDSANAFADDVVAQAKAQGDTHLADVITTERTRVDAQHAVGMSVQQGEDYLDSVVATIPPADPGTPASSLAATFDNKAVSQDTNTATADLDGHGLSMSAQALATAGVTPGSTVIHGGVVFHWPTQSGTGAADNTVADGQNIAVGGSGDTLGFLVASSFRTAAADSLTGTGTIHYSDGTSQRFLLDAPDWHGTDGDPAFTAAYTNAPGNTRQNTRVGVWYRGISLLPGKTLVSVELPGAHATDANGTPELHVFAMAVGTAAPELTDTFGNVSVTQDTATGYGDMDGWGSSMSAQALKAAGVGPGSTVTQEGLSFTWPTTAGVDDADGVTGAIYGEPDNTLAAGQTVAVDGTHGGTLGFLVAGANGAASGTATVTYSDGTTQQFTLTAPDWFKTSSAVAITAAYQNRLDNAQYQHVAYVHYVGVTLQSGRTPVSVTLPDVTSTPVQNSPVLHVYAMARG
ncbi:M4 family metallopeptidase [Streptomyces sp. NPDC050528]|uniref:M4 family metallopeptidase n=1 Tax=Streptomyces sp. NPDC050528 TaxID=3365623 RepID=UPI0037947A4C